MTDKGGWLFFLHVFGFTAWTLLWFLEITLMLWTTQTPDPNVTPTEHQPRLYFYIFLVDDIGSTFGLGVLLLILYMVHKFGDKKLKTEFELSMVQIFKSNPEHVTVKMLEHHNNVRLLNNNNEYAEVFLDDMCR